MERGEEVFEHRELTEKIIAAAMVVHKELGPGLLESIYEEALGIELAAAGLAFQRQIELPVVYKGQRLNGRFRADFVVENSVVIELKATELMHPVYGAQLLTYMRLGGWQVGLVLNFGLEAIRQGIKRIVL